MVFFFFSACAEFKDFQSFENLGKDLYNFIQEDKQVLWVGKHQIYWVKTSF